MFAGYKTVIFNVVMGGIMLVRALSPDAELPGEEAVSASIDAFEIGLTAVWGVGNLILRAITSSAIFTKPSV